MAIISVFAGDSVRFCADLFPDATAAGLRRVNTDEWLELTRLVAASNQLQQLLAEIRERPEIEFEEAIIEEAPISMGDTDAWQDHAYCKICGSCITCNLRPCHDGGPHQAGNQSNRFRVRRNPN